MFKEKLNKFLLLVLVVCILFTAVPVSYATKGEPNSTKITYDKNGNVKQERQYDENGKAKKDIDYSHGGVTHKFPHAHDWEWNGDKPHRNPGRPLNNDEIKNAAK